VMCSASHTIPGGCAAIDHPSDIAILGIDRSYHIVMLCCGKTKIQQIDLLFSRAAHPPAAARSPVCSSCARECLQLLLSCRAAVGALPTRRGHHQPGSPQLLDGGANSSLDVHDLPLHAVNLFIQLA
jgi:hypothetical protein